MGDGGGLVFRWGRLWGELFYWDIWLVSGEFIGGVWEGINVINWCGGDKGYFGRGGFGEE